MKLERWIDYSDNNIDAYVFDIKQKNDYVYIATNNGVEIILDSLARLIQNDIFSIFNFKLVTDLDFLNNFIYFATEIGLFKYSLEDDILIQVSDVVYNKIASDYVNNIYGTKRNKIFALNNSKNKYLGHYKNIKDICYCNDFIWINNYKYTTIYDLNLDESIEYNELDGLMSSKIFNIHCDNDWVWFSTNKGLVLYNWSKYHGNEK